MSAVMEQDKIYVSPVVFGPALCSVQNPAGARYGREQKKEHVRQYTLSFEAEALKLEQWLPDGLSLAAPQLLVRCEELTEVLWLAGRSIYREQVFLPVKRGEVAGFFCPISWESNGDSIIQGRDLFGKAVVFGDVTLGQEKGWQELSVSNWGFTFLELKMKFSKEKERDEVSRLLEEAKGIYHHRYLPMTGEGFVYSDADYLVYLPLGEEGGPGQPCTGQIRWNRPDFQQAPTQYYFLQPLAELKLGACSGGRYVEFDRYDDCYEQRILV